MNDPDSQSHRDESRWAVAREQMVRTQIEARGVRDDRVLTALRTVPRHLFVPEPLRPEAYADRALPLEAGQTVSQPYMVAYMTDLLDLSPGMKVLEVGTGSGYQAAVLAELSADLITVERLPELAESARKRLKTLGFGRIHVRCGDGSMGIPEDAPFDRILVTAGAPQVPRPLVDQLAEGGRLVVPVGQSGNQALVRVDRMPGRIVETTGLPCRFVRLMGDAGWDGRQQHSAG